jgi:hypothetical protein
MASPSATNNMENTLSCSICIDRFKTPKVLPCLHSFCEACLSSHIIQTAKLGVTQFLCPICREPTNNPKPGTPVANWSRHFLTDHRIIDFMDSWDQVVSEQVSTLIWPCADHPANQLAAFCEDHVDPCCIMCVAKGRHRRCDHVISLNELAQTIRDTKECEALVLQLDKIASQASKSIDGHKNCMDTLNRSKVCAIVDIKEKLKTLFDHLTGHINTTKGHDVMITEIKTRLTVVFDQMKNSIITKHKHKVKDIKQRMSKCELLQEACLKSKSECRTSTTLSATDQSLSLTVVAMRLKCVKCASYEHDITTELDIVQDVKLQFIDNNLFENITDECQLYVQDYHKRRSGQTNEGLEASGHIDVRASQNGGVGEIDGSAWARQRGHDLGDMNGIVGASQRGHDLGEMNGIVGASQRGHDLGEMNGIVGASQRRHDLGEMNGIVGASQRGHDLGGVINRPFACENIFQFRREGANSKTEWRIKRNTSIPRTRSRRGKSEGRGPRGVYHRNQHGNQNYLYAGVFSVFLFILIFPLIFPFIL